MALESLVFNGLSLNDSTNYRIQGLEIPPPSKKPEWVTGADGDGGALVRDPLFENREIKIRLRVSPRATMDLALAAVAAISDKIEEAEKQPDGLDLVWTPANSTKSFTFKVLSGAITDLPLTTAGGDDFGWFGTAPSPVVLVTLTCKPFGYGAEVTLSSSSSATPFVTLTAASVTGDVPAEARLIVTDAATQTRRYVEWGLEQRYYDAATSLLVDSDNMVTSGYAGAGTTRSGAYDPGASGNSVIRATVYPPPSAVCGTGNLTHVGTYRVKARVYSTAFGGNSWIRLEWSDGAGQRSVNDWAVVPVAAQFAEVDLGLITIPPATLGSQRWSGDLVAYTSESSATFDVDYLVLVPAGEGYGKSRAQYVYSPGVIVAGDPFNSIVGGTALNGRTAPIGGGTWATSGTATDFVAADSPGGDETMMRTVVTDSGDGRLAILGSTNYTDTDVRIAHYYAPGANQRARVIARYVDASNYAFLEIDHSGSTEFRIGVRIAGTDSLLQRAPFGFNPNIYLSMRVVIYASGRIFGLLDWGSGIAAIQSGFHTALATGGALATGKPGFSDYAASGAATANRWYEDFYVATPPAEPVSIFSGQAAEVRSDAALRADSAGAVWANIPGYRGTGFFLPAAGAAGRTSRVLVKAHRTDIESAESTNVTDNLTAQIKYTPRFVAVPR